MSASARLISSRSERAGRTRRTAGAASAPGTCELAGPLRAPRAAASAPGDPGTSPAPSKQRRAHWATATSLGYLRRESRGKRSGPPPRRWIFDAEKAVASAPGSEKRAGRPGLCAGARSSTPRKPWPARRAAESAPGLRASAPALDLRRRVCRGERAGAERAGFGCASLQRLAHMSERGFCHGKSIGPQ